MRPKSPFEGVSFSFLGFVLPNKNAAKRSSFAAFSGLEMMAGGLGFESQGAPRLSPSISAKVTSHAFHCNYAFFSERRRIFLFVPPKACPLITVRTSAIFPLWSIPLKAVGSRVWTNGMQLDVGNVDRSGFDLGQKRSPTISSLLTQSALACSGSSAYGRTPGLTGLMSPSVTCDTWQFSE